MATMTRPGGYYYWGMSAGDDETRIFTLYSTYDKTTDTGTPVNLTGCSLKAEGRDSAGTSQWEVTPTAATPSNGEVTITVPSATTTSKKGLSGDWALRVTWTDGKKTSPAWGRWSISSIVLVD